MLESGSGKFGSKGESGSLEARRPRSYWRSMRGRALFLLVLAAAGGAAAWPFRGGWAGGMILAACEAALVGGLADWFAVVALFRHPFNLSWLPHTAIVPANRENIVNGIVDIVENDWLKVDAIEAKIQSLPLVDGLLNAAGSRRGRHRLRIIVGGLIGDLVRSLDADRVAAYLEKAIHDTVVVPLTVDVVRTMELGAYEDEIMDFVLDQFVVLLDTLDLKALFARYLKKATEDYKRSGFLRRLSLDTGEYLKIIDYEEAGRVAAQRLADLVGRMREPEDEYRSRLKTVLFNLQGNEALQHLIDSWKNDALGRLDFTRSISSFVAGIQKSASGGIISNVRSSNQLLNHVMDLLNDQLARLREDTAQREKLDHWLKNELIRLVGKNHAVIGDLVRDNLERLNVQSFVASVEDRVGDDLQWIRINGTLVGALVGIGLYLASHLAALIR